MWIDIKNSTDIAYLLEKVNFFHDSCIKEMKYVSGAYVNEELTMQPINHTRKLNVIIQRQSQDTPMLEMEFGGLVYLNLYPNDETYTCEILESTLLIKDGFIYWTDQDGLSENNIDYCNGTLICALNLRYRLFKENVGKNEIYTSII